MSLPNHERETIQGEQTEKNDRKTSSLGGLLQPSTEKKSFFVLSTDQHFSRSFIRIADILPASIRRT